jgi:hypothetical protein
VTPTGRARWPTPFLYLASDEADHITGTTIVVDGQMLPEGSDVRTQPGGACVSRDDVEAGTATIDLTGSAEWVRGPVFPDRHPLPIALRPR